MVGKFSKYWAENPPQTWYSDKKPLSNEWFNEIAYLRYNRYYKYLPSVTEFDSHYGEKVLEIGVGIGTDLVEYAKNGSIVYGVDLTENAIKISEANFKRLKLKSNLKIANAVSLPYETGMFDLVFCFGVLHHIPNTEKAIQEIYRVLKPDGKAIIMLYAVGWKHIFKRLFINGILRGDLFRFGYQGTINKNTEPQGNSPLTKVYTKRAIKKLFKDFDIEITKHRLGEYFDYAPYNTKKFPDIIVKIMYALGLERMLGENWIIKATKSKKEKISVFKTLLKP